MPSQEPLAQLQVLLDQLLKTKSPQKKILCAAAVLTTPFTSDLMAALTRLSERGVKTHLNRLHQQGIIEEIYQSGVFRLISNTFRNNILSHLTDEEIRFWHRMAASSLSQKQQTRDWDVRYSIAVHSVHARLPSAMDCLLNAIPMEIARGRDENARHLISLGTAEADLEPTALIFWMGYLHYFRSEMGVARKILNKFLKSIPESQGQANDTVLTEFLLTDIISHQDPCYSHPNAVKGLITRFSEISSSVISEGLRPLLNRWLPALVTGPFKQIINHLPRDQAAEMALIQQDNATAEGAFRVLMGEMRREQDRMQAARTLAVTGWFHYINGDSQRSIRILKMAESIMKQCHRPNLLFTVRQRRFQVLMDIGDPSGALTLFEEAIADIENTPITGLNEGPVICCLQAALRLNDEDLIGGIWSVLLKHPDVLSPESLYELGFLLPILPPQYADGLPVLLDRIEVVLTDYWRGYPANPLPSLLRMLLNFDTGHPGCSKLRNLWESAEYWGDPRLISLFFLLPNLNLGQESFLIPITFEAHLQHLIMPQCRSQVMDLLYFHALGNCADQDETAVFCVYEMLQSRDLAIRIGDQVRYERARRALGERLTETLMASPGTAGASGDLLNDIIQIQNAASLQELSAILGGIFRVRAGIDTGEIIRVDETAGKTVLTWGDKLPFPTQKRVHRSLEKLRRSPDVSGFDIQKGLIVRLHHRPGFQCGLILRLRDGEFNKIPENLPSDIDVIIQTTSFVLEYLLNRSQKEKVSGRIRPLSKTRTAAGDMIGESPVMGKIRDYIHRITDSPSTIHITGETGTGKELVARSIHFSGSRRMKPFVAYHCAAASETLIESELFGHVRGAFTGAIQSRQGVFLAAAGGTLFLDEIGEISPGIQIKLLRALQERKIRPLGSDQDRDIDVRIVSATHRNLAVEVRSGRFREDLYYRLMVLSVETPPLRDRSEDIPLLVDSFLCSMSAKLQRSGVRITENAVKRLMTYAWPGNIRELQNVIEACVNLVDGDLVIDESLVGRMIHHHDHRPSKTLAEVASTAEYAYIQRVMYYCDDNVSRSAAILGISRQGLFKKLKQIGILRSGSENESDDGR